MTRMVQSVIELIGNTPAVRLQRLTGPEDAQVFVKLEKMNPSGSVKIVRLPDC